MRMLGKCKALYYPDPRPSCQHQLTAVDTEKKIRCNYESRLQRETRSRSRNAANWLGGGRWGDFVLCDKFVQETILNPIYGKQKEKYGGEEKREKMD